MAAAVLLGVTAWAVWPADKSPGVALASPSVLSISATPTGNGATCAYSPSSGTPAAKNVGRPANSSDTPATGTVQVTLKTNQGDIPMTLDRAKAPCTVQSFLFLAEKKYFDGTPCHRLTTDSTLRVLQCGDPSGLGTGGPGYQFRDELPTGLTRVAGDVVVYPAGTVAMANAGPDTNGSQFFLVYADSTLPPNYSIFGTYTTPGQGTIDKIVAGGVVPNNSNEDGAPKSPVTVERASVGG